MKAKESRIEVGKANYLSAMGVDEMKRDKDGFIHLTPTAKRADEQAVSLTTSISSLEEKLNKYRAEKAKVDKFKESDEYKESKKKQKGKKQKKKKQALLDMVFNNADHLAEEEDEEVETDEENYKDSKKKKKAQKKETTLDTTYGKRFSPVVSMLHDTINEFDKIAEDIQAELDSPQLRSKSMYRSNQIGNLISAKNSKLSAVKELASVATTISNLEYKKDKDRKAEEGSDTSKAISMLGAKYLRGGFETQEERKSKKKKKKSWDDEDDDVGTIKKASSKKSNDDDDDQDESDRELASQLAKALGKHPDIKFTAAERFVKLEGTWNCVVIADSDDPKSDWRFAAIDPSTGKIIKDFKEKYPGLLPKKKNARMQFDVNRNKAYDKTSGRTYKLFLE